MTEDFNYRMSTKYKDEFKNLITYEKLYKTINEERKKTELSSFDAREIFTRRDKSGIFNKLKNQLHFYIKDYNKSDEEKFNILKFYH